MLSGPLAGLVVPPVFATLSDGCASKMGKRKPFVLWGGVVVVISLVLLAQVEDLGRLLSPLSAATGRGLAKFVAAAAMYAINFAMQPLNLGMRALAVDFFPPHQQPLVSLWSSRFQSLGAVFIALVGYVGNKPLFDVLARVSAATLSLLLLPVLIADPGQTWVRRKPAPAPRASPHRRGLSLCDYPRGVWSKMCHLPPVTRKACRTQLFAWFFWFPILVYTST